MASSSSSPKASGGIAAKLVLTKQESGQQDTVYKNGENKLLHTVVKVHPFIIELGLDGEFDRHSVNFHKCPLEATLMYDTPAGSPPKPVHYVSRVPVEYNCTVLNAEGDKVRVECALHVLSSQHEGAYFRLRFSMAPGCGDLQVLSDPIRVVSKQLQLRKFKEEKARQQQLLAAQQKQQQQQHQEQERGSTKRSFDDMLQETLSRIEAQQQAQQTLISSLFQTVMTQLSSSPAAESPSTTPYYSSLSSSVASPASSPTFTQPPPAVKRRRTWSESPMDQPSPSTPAPSTPTQQQADARTSFETHLRGALEAYRTLAAASSAHVVRSVVRRVAHESMSHRERLTEMAEVLCTEGLRRTSSSSLKVTHRARQNQPTSYFLGAPFAHDSVAISDDDCSEAWLCSTESSPMSPGGEDGQEMPIFTLNAAAVDNNNDEDKLYNELFSGQSWVLEEGGDYSPAL